MELSQSRVENNLGKRIYVAGHRGMVGSAILRKLKSLGYYNIISKTRRDLDLTNQAEVRAFFAGEKPEQVYLAAAKVGGIIANNNHPADFIYENLLIQCNVIQAAFESKVKSLLFLGSSCIYPKFATQPMKEDQLLTGKLEATNEPYAIAKIAGIKLCESYNRQYFDTHQIDYRSIMPTNLYGPRDNYHPTNAHVIPALIRRFHEAKITNRPEVSIYGTGKPKREFLHVDDMADACYRIMSLHREEFMKHVNPMNSHVNVGYGEDISIANLAKLIAKTVQYQGKVTYDVSKPDGTPRKLMDSSRLRTLGWQPRINLEEGLKDAYNDFLQTAEPRLK